MYNIVCGIVSYNLSRYRPIKVYKLFILIMESRRPETKNMFFVNVFKLLTLYLNRRETLRNRTNYGIVVFWLKKNRIFLLLFFFFYLYYYYYIYISYYY
jgi:hypothetical protein